ncbi:hypothetical protein BS47DRAFT_1352984, partial [Hydnum rufescens UP504]
MSLAISVTHADAHPHPQYSLPLPNSKFPGASSPCVLAMHMRMLLISSGISVLV